MEIAKRCNIHITLGKNFLPLFPTPDGLSLDDYLVKLSNEGLQERMVQLYPRRGGAGGENAGISGAAGF